MTILIVTAIIVVGILLLIFSSGTGDAKNAELYSVYTADGLKLVKKLEEMVERNQTLRYLGIRNLYFELTGSALGETLDEIESTMGIEGYTDEPENSRKAMAGQYFDDLQWILAHRHRNEYETLYMFDEAESLKKFGLNIHHDEFIHEYASKGVDWFEEKIKTTSINYGGLRWSAGSGNLRYTMGSLSVTPNKQNYFKFIDRGSLYLTNKRLIFVGRENGQNRTIKIDDLLEFSLFRNGILIGKSNGKKPLIEFADYIPQPNQAFIQRDHLNRMTRALNRVLSNTQFLKLEQEL